MGGPYWAYFWKCLVDLSPKHHETTPQSTPAGSKKSPRSQVEVPGRFNDFFKIAVILTSMNSYELVFWGQELQHARKTPAKGGARSAPPLLMRRFSCMLQFLSPNNQLVRIHTRKNNCYNLCFVLLALSSRLQSPRNAGGTCCVRGSTS